MDRDICIPLSRLKPSERVIACLIEDQKYVKKTNTNDVKH